MHEGLIARLDHVRPLPDHDLTLAADAIRDLLKGRTPRVHDLTGRTFGKLTAACLDGRLWLCLCECGNEHLADASLLLNGSITSCGCLPVGSKRGSRQPHRRVRDHEGNLHKGVASAARHWRMSEREVRHLVELGDRGWSYA